MHERDPLVDVLDEGRADEGLTVRARERSLWAAAEEGAQFAGTLVDLAERGSPVAVRSQTGRTHHGALTAVGADFCVVRADNGTEIHVRLSAIATVRPHAGEHHGAATGDRGPVLDRLLTEVLGRVAEERRRVTLVTRGGDVVAGRLRAVGADVVSVDLDGGGRQSCYVAAAAITEVVVDR